MSMENNSQIEEKTEKLHPGANLEKQLEIASRLLSLRELAERAGEPVEPDDGTLLAELVVELHEWLKGGGYLPAQRNAVYGEAVGS